MQRRHQNHNGYHGETIDIHAVVNEAAAVAMAQGWTGETFLQAPEFQLTAWHRPAQAGSGRGQHSEGIRRIHISTGIHGDEPAGPLAALRLLRENIWPAHCEIFLVPCLNPAGFVRNRRENAGGLDLNRDYLNPKSSEIQAHVAWLQRHSPFDLSLALHEDWEANGFYLYELNPHNEPSAAEVMVAAASGVCPIDLASVIEGREAKNGIIRPTLDPRARPLWPESFWLIQHGTRHAFTLEAPSDFPLAVRVDALVAAVQAALANCG